MKAAAVSFILSLALLAAPAGAWARDSVLPAGTLLTCTLDEPNFSSATASVGDPVLCHPHGLQVFGQTVFPRGTYIVGHLADDKDPGHFWGKGYLKIEFDRIGLPGADVPLSAKMVAVSGGYRVDKEGKIIGKGHAKRDIVEWLIPPLWPWKILTLPARGPRPTLKGESRVTLKLMEDVLVPEGGNWQRFGRLDSGGSYAKPALYLRPRSLPAPPALTDAPLYRQISWQPQSSGGPSPSDSRAATVTPADRSGWHSFKKPAASMPPAAPPNPPAATDADADGDYAATPVTTTAGDKASAPVAPAAAGVGANTTEAPAAYPPGAEALGTIPRKHPAVDIPAGATVVPAVATSATGDTAALAKTVETENATISATPVVQTQKQRLTLLALRTGTVYAATDYWRDEDRLVYILPNGKEGQVDMGDLDWKTTTQLNSDRNVKVTLREGK